MIKLITKLRILLSPANVIVEIKNNKVNTKKGKAGSSTLRELKDVIQKNDIKYACIFYSKNKKKLDLIGIPQNIEQKIRNVWYNNHRSL